MEPVVTRLLDDLLQACVDTHCLFSLHASCQSHPFD